MGTLTAGQVVIVHFPFLRSHRVQTAPGGDGLFRSHRHRQRAAAAALAAKVISHLPNEHGIDVVTILEQST